MIKKHIIDKLVNNIFNIKCQNVNIDHNGTFKDFLGDILYKPLSGLQEDILFHFKDIIEQKVKGAIKNPNEIDSAINYINTEVLKSYKFRYKYSDGNDWIQIVKSVINKRLIDFIKKNQRQQRMVYNDGTFINNAKYLDYYYVKSIDHSYKVVDFNDQVQFVIKIINQNKNKFLNIEWDYINCILFLYDNGFDPLDANLLYLVMGYETGNVLHKKEFNRIKNKVTKKIKKMICKISNGDDTTEQ